MYGEYGSGQRKIHIVNQDSGATEKGAMDDEFIPFEMNKAQKLVILQKMEEEFRTQRVKILMLLRGIRISRGSTFLISAKLNQRNVFLSAIAIKMAWVTLTKFALVQIPQAADSDLDGFIDGDEVKSGFDPVKYSPGDHSDQMVFESPENARIGRTELCGSECYDAEIRYWWTETSFGGERTPNSFVTIYIYSDPIVLTVKTDSEGNWTYELDKNLEDGNHEAYVAVTDNTGKITAKSEPIAFVKIAQAVTVLPAAEAPRSNSDSSGNTESYAERFAVIGGYYYRGTCSSTRNCWLYQA